MKTKSSTILKSSIALILSVLMIFGSLSTVLAATVDNLNRVKFHADLTGYTGSGTAMSAWSNQSLTAADSNHYYGTFYTAASQSKKEFGWNVGGSNWGDSWCTMNGEHFTATQTYEKTKDMVFRGSNDKVSTIAATSGWVKLQIDWYGSYSNSSYVKFYQTAVTALSSSVSAGSTTLTAGSTTTITPSSSGGTGTPTNSVKVYQGSASGTDVTSSVLSGTTFTAPNVTSTTKYYVINTATDPTIKSYTKASSALAITVNPAAAALSAPTNVKLNSTAGNVSVNANPSGNATLSWDTVTNAGSYEVYKGTTKVTTVTTTSYNIPLKYSNTGEYSVKAVPSNTASYRTSAASTARTLTVNKVQMTAPSVTLSKTDIKKGDSTVATISNFSTLNSSYISGGYATLKRATRAYQATTGSGTADGTATSGSDTLSPTSSKQYFYYLAPTTAGSDYFTQSGNSAFLDVYVADASAYRIAGESNFIGSSSWSYANGKDFTNYTSDGIFYFTSKSVGSGDHYFKMYKESDEKGYTYSGSSDTSITLGDTNKYTFAVQNDTYSFKVNGSGVFVIYYDTVNDKIWVTQNTWQISTAAYTQQYDVATGAYKTATASTTGGAVDPTSVNVEKTKSTTLEATANSGYTFDGWYDSTTFANKVSSNASYTFTPSANGTYYALFKQNPPQLVNIAVDNVANATINATWNGTTKTNGQSLSNVPVGASVTVTVSPASGYYVTENTPTLTNGKFTVTASTTSISATVAKNATIKAVTNKSSRGTVSVDKTSAHKDEVVKITVTPLAGKLKTLTATYANGKVYEYKNSNWSEVIKSGSAAVPAHIRAKELALAAVGAMYDVAFTGAAQTINMTMQYTSDVTINATFDTYSAESNYYYNGYDTSGNALSGYTKKQMTEVMLEGVPYSYYQVSGRSGADQLMTVSKQTGTGNTGYAYFTRPSNWGSVWSNTKAPYAYFFNDSGQVGANYPGTMMTFISGTDHDFKIAIPDGATKVIFSDSESGGSGAQTVDITMTSTTSAYYLSGGYQDIDGTRKYEVTAWGSQPSDAGIQTNTTEYWYNASNRYYGYVNGFNEGKNSWNTQEAGSHTTDGNRFAKPNDNMGNNSYYVMVFYAGNKYTSGSGTLDLTGNENHDVVMWSYELPSGSDDENVTVYAKDGSIRADTFGATYANIADTKIYLNDTVVGTDHSGNITNQTYQTYKAAKGDTLVIKTQIGATDSSDTGVTGYADLRSKYYVRGFCVNGEVSELLEWNANGLYTLTFKIPEDTEITKFEITPIYYLKDTTNNPIVTYRVTGFTDELKAVGTGKPGWGNTLYTYPYYGKLGGQNNAFGAYPGQPMVYYKGQYQMQIPQKSTAWDPYDATAATVNNTTVSGVTMSNGYWDSVHKSIMGYGDNSTSADHVQTYDYGDFYKIFNEKKPVDNIVFDFKYRTKKHNFENQPAASTNKSTLDTNYGTNGNGFELLTNFHGRTVDLFGTPLSGDQLNATPVYVVSIGGVNETSHTGVENIAGYYATEWMVYGSSNGTSYTRITGGGKNSIPPEVLVLNDDDNTSFNTSTYPSADASHNVTDWKTLYHNLEAYRGKPVMISYEAADAQQGQSMFYAGTGGATRNDGRWLYSKNGESITSNIKIQYSDDNGDTYTDLDTTSPQVTGLYAYFTNSEVAEGAMTFSTTINPDKTFDFEAKRTNASYKFVGWYMADGTKITTENASHTERSGSYTFVAKFMKVTSGQLTISHTVDTDSTYKGSGNVSVAAVVYNEEDEVFRTYSAANSITMDDKVIKSDQSEYKIVVTLTQAPAGYDIFAKTTCDPVNSKFLASNPDTTAYSSKTIEFKVGDLFTTTSGTTNQNVLSIMYHTFYTKTEFTYEFTYNYNGRLANSQSYKRTGTLTAAQVKDYVSGSTAKLSKNFPISLAPHESNFNETLIWSINDDITVGSGNKFTASYTAVKYTGPTTTEIPKVRSTARTATFDMDNDGDTTPNTVYNIKYGELIKNNGDYITAPEKSGEIFQYWKIMTADPDSSKRTEVARCYSSEFNYLAYDNYYIVPVYGDSSIDFDNEGASTSINYLDTTRNQWNDYGNGGYTIANQDKRNQASDLLFNDFALSYGYNGQRLYESNDPIDNKDVEVGFIVEKVKKMDLKQDGTYDTDISKYVAGGSDAATALTNATNAINNITVDGFKAQTGTGDYKSYTKYKINRTSLDNKNRIEFFYALYNAYGQKEDGTALTKLANKSYVYRAYSYIKVGETLTVTDNPAYFTMYDEATK